MTRYTKNAQGHYLIHGHKFEMLEGSRAQVMHGTAYKTSGGLKKNDLLQNKSGRIVSRKKHATAKKEKRLIKAGFGTKKGHFGAVKIGKRGSKKMRGGYSSGINSNPEGVDGVGTSAFVSGQTPYHLAGGKHRKGKKGHRGGSTSMSNMPSMSNMLNSVSKSLSAAVPMPGNLAKMPTAGHASAK